MMNIVQTILQRPSRALVASRLAIIMCLAASLTIQAKSDASSDSTKPSALTAVMHTWPGDYDNQAQVDKLQAQGKPIWREDGSGEGGHIVVKSHYRLVDLPELGENVLYVEELKHGKPDLVFRQRLYSLTENPATGQVQVKMWYFNDKKKYVGAWQDLSKLSGITKEELFPLQDDCDLTVTQEGDKYHMVMPDKQCIFGEKYFDYQVLLGADSFWFRDQIRLVKDDSVVSRAGDFTYHELQRLN